ncbi:MAG TPA: LL-diaminopimelate aminotransferase [Elusimicrobiota bacterium]|nr:LL-diaminopimelate aminotransferase [Elusimicrobiota bacterium]
MSFAASDRLGQLPPYLFAAIDAKKKAAQEKGADIISLGVGDPDLPTPAHIVEAGKRGLENPANHQYPFGAGLMSFRRAVADWYRKRFNVELNPETEIHSLIGSKDGLTHLPLAFLNPGDLALIPEPAYPAYNAAVLLAGGRPHFVPLLEKNKFLPDFDAVPKDVLGKAKLLFINYPSNPISVTAPRSFYESVVALARKHKFLVVHDAAYSEMYYEAPPMSFLEVPGAKEVGIEFHSCSKTYNMTGWRIGWVCGNAGAVKILGRLKDNYDSGVFQAVQDAGVAALTGPQDGVAAMRAMYKERRDFFVPGLQKLGWDVFLPPATFYVWAKVPQGQTSARTAERLLEEAHLVCTPGNGFGPSGEGYVRFALTVPLPRLQEALARVARVKW